jgi:hypothetical protein
VSVPTALRYLADHTWWLAHHPEAVQAYEELEKALGILETAIDLPTPTSYAGPCDVCRKDLYAKPDSETVECKACNLIYDMEARREWLLQSLEDRLERSTDIARALTAYGRELRRKRIDVWASRGILVAHSQDRSGNPLYRIGDVMRLLDTMPDDTRKASTG